MSKRPLKTGKNQPEAAQSDPNVLKTLLAADRAAREQRAVEKYNQMIQSIEAEERCTVTPVMTIRPGNLQAGIEIKALD